MHMHASNAECTLSSLSFHFHLKTPEIIENLFLFRQIGDGTVKEYEIKQQQQKIGKNSTKKNEKKKNNEKEKQNTKENENQFSKCKRMTKIETQI